MVGASRYSYQKRFLDGYRTLFRRSGRHGYRVTLGRKRIAQIGSRRRRFRRIDVVCFLGDLPKQCRVDTNVVESLERCRRKGKGMYEYDGSVRRQPVGKLAGPGVPQKNFSLCIAGKIPTGHSRRRKAKEITCVYLILGGWFWGVRSIRCRRIEILGRPVRYRCPARRCDRHSRGKVTKASVD